ncbi:hypothetical protein ACFQ1S_04305 [Kibdelosporangium lantanae]|uniref:Uncharacterized protein n=1 Tax=Kibdelosporangium lantanae TaxID=1497396 RepID=A0ABW3M2G9_9PSEU
MAGYQLMNTLDEVDAAMQALLAAMQDMPIRRDGFRADHRKLTRKTALLAVEMADNGPAFGLDY